MPRLTNQLYLDRRQFLRRVWRDFPQLYSILLPLAQWRVHTYYQTQVEADDASLLANRKVLGTEEPSLPQAASKAFHRLYFGFRVAFEYADGDGLRFHEALTQLQQNDLTIRAIAQPDTDICKLAEVFILASQGPSFDNTATKGDR